MKEVRFWILIAWWAMVTGSFAAQAESALPVSETPAQALEKKDIPSFHALQSNWVFSGIVTTEGGDHYNYYFQIVRNDTQFHALAALIDSQNKRVLLYEEGKAAIEPSELSNWQIGRAFLQFNPINDSWVFGVKTKDKKGFNFKVDMLRQQAAYTAGKQDLRAGVELLVNQTGRLNGHIEMGEKSAEQFVTAPKAWFKQVWTSKPQKASHPLLGVLCQFNDGSGFYSVNMKESDALRGAVAGWRDIQGMPVSMSQFVSVKEAEDNVWHIRVPAPKINLSLIDALAQQGNHQLIAGMAEGSMSGFCTISKEEIGQPEQVVSKPGEVKE